MFPLKSVMYTVGTVIISPWLNPYWYIKSDKTSKGIAKPHKPSETLANKQKSK
jgi:hypothetical protein